jgi:hypothetical protein
VYYYIAFNVYTKFHSLLFTVLGIPWNGRWIDFYVCDIVIMVLSLSLFEELAMLCVVQWSEQNSLIKYTQVYSHLEDSECQVVCSH